MLSQYTYDSTTKFLNSITLNNGDGNSSTYNYTYDTTYSRITKVTENSAYAEFSKEFTYDTFGRIDTEEYYAKLLANNTSSIKKIKNVYQNGEIKAVKDFATNETIWNIDAVNARGQLTSATMGNGIHEQNTYNNYGYLTETKISKNALTSPEEIMKLNFNYDTQRGLLNTRTNSLFSWSETFGYDALDRLVTFNDNNGNNGHTYDARGRITLNNTIGDYNYAGNSYQLGNVDLNNQGDLYYQQNSLQNVKYNAVKKPVEISEVGKEKIGFQYNTFMGRSNMFYGDEQTDILQRRNRKHYSYEGSMEISYDTATDKTVFVTYIGGDAYGAPAIWRSEVLGGTTSDYYYLHRDYLGSIIMISDKDGNIEEKRHFDAWGNIVKVADGNNNALEKLEFIDRGYTGHEHLQGVGLIHMNGRLYDPKLRRFLAPDNYIQDVTNTQNFNRYGYVLNNPLMHTDPSGEFILEAITLVVIVKALFVISAAIGGYAIIKNLDDQSSGSGSSPSNPISSTSQNNSQEVTAGLTPYSLDYKFDMPMGIHQAGGVFGDVPMNTATAQAIAFNNAMFSNLANGHGLGGGEDEGITGWDIADTVADFIPIVGSVKDIYQGIRDGNGWQVAMGAGFLVLDVVTLGSSSLIKGAIKTGVKQGFKAGSKALAKNAFNKGVNYTTTAIGRMDDLKKYDKIANIDSWRKSGFKNMDGGPVTWKQNKKWLEDRIARGDNFILGTNRSSLPNRIGGYIPGTPNGYFTAKELHHLIKNGINVLDDF